MLMFRRGDEEAGLLEWVTPKAKVAELFAAATEWMSCTKLIL